MSGTTINAGWWVQWTLPTTHKTSLSSGRLHLLSLVRSTRSMQDCSDGILAEPDMAADQPVAQTSLCQLGLSALLGHGNTTSWTNQERASVT